MHGCRYHGGTIYPLHQALSPLSPTITLKGPRWGTLTSPLFVNVHSRYPVSRLGVNFRRHFSLSTSRKSRDDDRTRTGIYRPLLQDETQNKYRDITALRKISSQGESSSRRSTRLDAISSQQQEGRPSRDALPTWRVQKDALAQRFSDGWTPHKRLSPDAIDGIRALNAQQPEVYTTEVLSQEFEVSPEAIRRILKSKWRPSEKEAEDRQRRWENRGLGVWAAKAAMGYKPPQRWRQLMDDKIGQEGEDAAIELIKRPVAQAMLKRDMELRQKAHEEHLRHRRDAERRRKSEARIKIQQLEQAELKAEARQRAKARKQAKISTVNNPKSLETKSSVASDG